MTKLSGNRLKMSDGSIRKFKSKKARDNFERVARAKKHGWKGPFKPKTKRSPSKKNGR